MSAFHSRIRRTSFRRFSSVGINSPSWMSNTSVLMPNNSAKRLTSAVQALGQRPSRHVPVPNIPVGHRDELDMMPLCRPLGRHTARLQLAVVGVGTNAITRNLPSSGMAVAAGVRARQRATLARTRYPIPTWHPLDKSTTAPIPPRSQTNPCACRSVSSRPPTPTQVFGKTIQVQHVQRAIL